MSTSPSLPRSPPSSLSSRSPPSSPPVCDEEPPLKKPRWQVFAFREGNCQTSASTTRRWRERGFIDDKTEIAHHQNAEDNVVQVEDNKDESDSSASGIHSDSASDVPSSESEGHPFNSSQDSNDFQLGEIGHDWYDSEEELEHGSSDAEENDAFIPLYKDCKYSREEAILDLMDDFLNNKESQTSLKDHLATFVKYLPEGHTMPKSIHLLFKFLKNFAPSYVASTYYYCSKCLFYRDNLDGDCPSCKESSTREFYMFDLKQQVKFYFEHCDLANIIEKFKQECDARGSTISDICDGTEYQRCNIGNSCRVTLKWNTDGVELSKSSKCSLYPVLATICEIPPKMRSRFMIVVGVWCDTVAPPMNTLLYPFSMALKNIEEDGGVSWVDPSSNVVHQASVIAPIACADAPVRAQIQNIMGHRSKQACNTCEQRTISIPLTRAQRRARARGDKKIRKARGFLYQEQEAQLRTDRRMAAQAQKAFLEGQPVKGVVGPSVVKQIPHLDVSTCVYAEYMHGVCLGVVRHFANLWINVKGDWYVGDRVGEIDSLMLKIRPPQSINRLPRGISDLFKWKASELRAFLLFYSLPIVDQFLPRPYVQHWMLFVTAVWLLLQEDISESDLEKADKLLKLFVKDIGRLYRPVDYVFNCHQLIHLSLYVKRWGPLWATSAFQFEDFNRILSKIIHGTKNRAKELVNLLRVSHGVELLRDKILKRHDAEIGSDLKLNSELHIDKLSDYDRNFLNSNDIHEPFKVFCRVTLRNKLAFTSLNYCRENKRVNFCVSYKTDGIVHYGNIKYFVCKGPDSIFAVIQTLAVDHCKMFFQLAARCKVPHIIPVSNSNALALVSVTDLKKIVKLDSYVCLLPNQYEYSL